MGHISLDDQRMGDSPEARPATAPIRFARLALVAGALLLIPYILMGYLSPKSLLVTYIGKEEAESATDELLKTASCYGKVMALLCASLMAHLLLLAPSKDVVLLRWTSFSISLVNVTGIVTYIVIIVKNWALGPLMYGDIVVMAFTSALFLAAFFKLSKVAPTTSAVSTTNADTRAFRVTLAMSLLCGLPYMVQMTCAPLPTFAQLYAFALPAETDVVIAASWGVALMQFQHAGTVLPAALRCGRDPALYRRLALGTAAVFLLAAAQVGWMVDQGLARREAFKAPVAMQVGFAGVFVYQFLGLRGERAQKQKEAGDGGPSGKPPVGRGARGEAPPPAK